MGDPVGGGASEKQAITVDILPLESAILKDDVLTARDCFRELLLKMIGLEGGASTGEALSQLSQNPLKARIAAIILLRCLGVQGLLPAPNHTNQIVRSTVQLCEGAAPEIMRFLKIDDKLQNIEKYNALTNCHQRLSEVLSPLQVPYGDLNALLNARKEILGSLNHSIIRQYCSPFLLKEVRSTVESIIGKLARLSETALSLLTDIEECNRAIVAARSEAITTSTFLTNNFLIPFLSNSEQAVAGFVVTLRGRFSTAISLTRAAGHQLQKKYPLHECGRELQVAIPFKNSGPGLATNVEVSATSNSDEIMLGSGFINLGNVLPGEFSVILDAIVISPTAAFPLMMHVSWGEIGDPTRKEDIFEVEVVAQASTIDWQSLEYKTPYSTGVARGEQFLGRIDRVRLLAAKLLRNPMEPFYITGQKRVGKTSLALATVEFAKDHCQNVILESHYVLWGSVAHADPMLSMRRLGEDIEDFIQRCLPRETTFPKGDYTGSLADLIRAANFASRISPNKRLVIVIDEFDEIHQELFLMGNLAETFFANLRALSRCMNICIVLVGGENMPFVMDRQGQKLNNFSRVSLNYYSRTTEWGDFQLLVKAPTLDTLNWHEDAISEVFNVTNGNPYFANIVCAAVMRLAVSERDADITSKEVERAVESEISTFGANSFAHLWQDGVLKPNSEREPDILRRMRVLVALARCLRHKQKTNIEAIAINRASSMLAEAEIGPILNDFVRREVLVERDQLYGFGLPIFQLWLVDVGVSQLVADTLNEELANIVLALENEALVRSEEIAALSRGWPTYQGKHVGSDDIRAWYQQVESIRDQRLLFELLKRTRIFTEVHVRERLRAAHSMLRPTLPEFVIRKRGERRKDVILTYVDGAGKSGAAYASTYAEENGISTDCVLSRSDLGERLRNHEKSDQRPAALLVIDDLAATGESLVDNLKSFCVEFGQLLHGIKVRVITLVATEEAQARIVRQVGEMQDIDIDFRSCEILPSSAFAFPPTASPWRSEEEAARAKALCNDLGTRIYPQNPLGYGGLGLLIVFPTTVPNNSLPILHSRSRTSSHHKWEPLFPRIAN
jgi:hypothetical protein